MRHTDVDLPNDSNEFVLDQGGEALEIIAEIDPSWALKNAASKYAVRPMAKKKL